MRTILIAAIVCLMTGCGTKYHYEDTGTSNGRFYCNMYEYLKSDHENWDSIARMIDRCGEDVIEIFQKEDITFFGPTNITIHKWFYWDSQNGGFADSVAYVPHGYTCIDDIPVDSCRKIVLSHVVNGVITRDDVPRATYNEEGVRNGGGMILTSRYGNKMWLWSVQEPYIGIPDIGPVVLDMASLKQNQTVNKNIGIASVGLKPDNGIVHSLPYSYSIGELFEAKIKNK